MESSRKKALTALLTLSFPMLLLADAPYKTGDLIFRLGKGFVSEFARNFSKSDKRFSHVGMIYLDQNRTYVVHTLDNEDKQFKHTVKEPFQNFLDDALNWKVYQLPITKKERFWLSYNINREIKSPKPFDYHFDLQTTDSYYCTELIWRLLQDSLGRDIVTNRTFRNRQPFLAIEDILHIAGLRPYDGILSQKKPKP